MNKQEIRKLLTMIENAYPRFYPTDEFKAKSKVELWSSFMKDWEYDKAEQNLRKHIESSPYEPKISEVKPKDRYKPDYSWKEGLYD